MSHQTAVAPGLAPGPGPTLAGSPRGRVRAAIVAALFAGIQLAERAAVAVYFRRLVVSHRGRFPAKGAVLLFANHPATWTDVLVLDVALARKLQYLAQDYLYRPRARAALLELHGALPVFSGPDSPGQRARNAETFRRCYERFDRGQVVAVFPEGVSGSDRRLLALKTGTARIALGYARGPLALLPVGLHYESRTSFRSDVTVSVGEPIPLERYRARPDAETAVHELTGRMRAALSGLVLDLPDPALVATLAEVESAGKRPNSLERLRRLAARVEPLRDAGSARFAELQREVRAYRRARAALGVSEAAIGHAPAHVGWLVALTALGAIPAAAGALLHALPWAAGERIARRQASDPTQFSFARIASGSILFPIEYLLFGMILRRLFHWPVHTLVAALVGVALLGIATEVYRKWLGALRERLRLASLERSHPRLIARARAGRGALADFLSRTGSAEPAIVSESRAS